MAGKGPSARRHWHLLGVFAAVQAAVALILVGMLGRASALEDTDAVVGSGSAAVGEVFYVSVDIQIDPGEPDRNFDAFDVTLSWDPALARIHVPDYSLPGGIGAPFVEEFPFNAQFTYNEAAGTLRIIAEDRAEPAQCFPACTLFTATFMALAPGSGPISATSALGPSLSANGQPVSASWHSGTMTITGAAPSPQLTPSPSPTATATSTATVSPTASPTASPSPSPTPELDNRYPAPHVAKDGSGP